MEADPRREPSGDGAKPPQEGEPAAWTRPLVKVDAVWTKIETYLVLGVLIAAILYMTGWVTLNAFHTKQGKLAKFPGIIATFAGLASAAAWSQRKDRKPKELILPGVLTVVGLVLLAVAKKQDYFANVARWLADASLIKQMGTPQIVSARLFTIWVALLGASLATGAGRQINIDVVMRFIGPRPRLLVALLGYVIASIACFVIAWGFLDYLAITRYGAAKDAKAGEKISTITKAIGRHSFLVRRQLLLDLRSFGHVVIKGQPFDKWYTGAEWNREINEAGWAEVYAPPPAKEPPPPGAPPYPTKPCLTQQEVEDLAAKGGSQHPEWRLPGVCDIGDGTGTRAPLATAPEPDDRTPLEADLSLLFPWGFFVIGLRFLLRGALAVGGAVSTDPNAAHGADAPMHVAEEPPIVEQRVDAEAKAHEGEKALPPDDVRERDARAANEAKGKASVESASTSEGEPPHHPALSNDIPTRVVEQPFDEAATVVRAPFDEAATIAESTGQPSSVPPPDVPTAQRLEVAAKIAQDDEDERTLVGDLSELARASELLEEKRRKEEEEKKGGKK